MEEDAFIEEENKLALPPPSYLTLAIAINGERKSKYVVKWALDKFIPEGILLFKLLHVIPRMSTVPTPMGNRIPISQVRDDVAAAYRKEIEWKTTEMLLPYKKMCIQRRVQVDVVVLESDNVANTISEEIAKSAIPKLVIGASSSSMFTRKLKGLSLSSRISEQTPSFCTVYAVSKGKLSSVRPSDSGTAGSFKDDSSDTSRSTHSSSSHASSSHADTESAVSYSSLRSPSLTMQRFQALSTINQTLLNTRTNSKGNSHSKSACLETREVEDAMSSCPNSVSDVGYTVNQASSNGRSIEEDNHSWVSDQASSSDAHTDSFSAESQENINFELERLRIELRHVKGMYAIAQNETIDASRKLNNLNKLRVEEANKLKEIELKEEKTEEIARQEKAKYEVLRREVDCVRECAEREALQRKEAENKALRESKEKEKLENVLVGPIHQYKKFTWEEIVSATSSFSDDLKIGLGAYGTVYKCSLHHTTAAVKVLHSKDDHKTKQFLQELKISSEIQHPHLLLLLGACPEQGCLVYEYMQNGSLEERLFRKDNTLPIPWFERYRIAWEVASALLFLHSSKPKPIIHRDVKPANILLDRNFVSKIGDVGLSTLFQWDPSSISAMGPVGTLCYIDPEYQRTGFVSPESDVYAFGMIILQLITARPAIALAHVVETAINDGRLTEILDPEAGKWPFEETMELAMLGLNCAEIRRRDRPDLKSQVLPKLERLKEIADKEKDLVSAVKLVPPNHFICPILKDVMEDPHVAADGFTYDRRAIEKWLKENHNSPMTSLPLPNKNLIPNYTLLSAIMEWKSLKQ